MTAFEKWSLIITTISVFATLLAVFVALFGEKLRQMWSSPRLQVALAEPSLTKTNAGAKGWYYLLRVSNAKPSNPANNVRVLLTRFERKALDDTWIDVHFSGPVQVSWRWPDQMPLYLTIGHDEIATFACVHQNDTGVALRLYWYPNNLDPRIMPGQPLRLTFQAVSDSAKSEPLRVRMSWDGSWVEGRLEMQDHLRMTEDHE